MEYNKPNYPEIQDEVENEYNEGYSEKQSALDTEIQAGGWANLTKFSKYVAYSRQQRIFLAYQAISNKLFHIIADNFLTTANNESKGLISAEMKNARMVQDILLNCLLWDQKGQLEEFMVPKEVWNLIK